MYASDKSGLSDPYSIMSFSRYSARSRVVKESVCPTWDQTLLINQIRLFGNPNSILESPPPVVIEFFDKDTIVSDSIHPCNLSEIYWFALVGSGRIPGKDLY